MERLLERMEALEREGRRNRRQAQVWRALAAALALVGLWGMAVRPVTARDAEDRHIQALEVRVTNLEKALNTEATLRLRGDSGLTTSLNQEIANRQAADANLQNQVTPLTTLFLAPNGVDGQPFFQRVGADFIITGANLHIVNGLGATNGNPASPILGPGATNGLGNLIVGYNELRSAGNDRSGSHNIVVGFADNFSSYGGLVVGQGNAITGTYASVSGGVDNTASADGAAVSGGHDNRATDAASSVSGGGLNVASFVGASVSGGFHNTAGRADGSVSGGVGVTVTAGDAPWAAGGTFFPIPPGGPGTFHCP